MRRRAWVRPTNRLTIDRQTDETRNGLKAVLRKGRWRRVTMYPARTPAGVDPGEMVGRRLAEHGPEDLLFTAPRGGLLRRSNLGPLPLGRRRRRRRLAVH